MPNSTQSTVFHILPTLRADAPHPNHSDKLMLFGQFIGIWELDIKFFDEAGHTIFHAPGEWAFSWVLDGRAIQDVITYAPLDDPSKTGSGERRTGTTLRYYDAKADVWRMLFLGATSGVFLPLIAKPVGGDILIEGAEDDGTLNRWTFTEITPDSFHWIGKVSTDGGVSWWMVQEMFARRHA
jgi:hypothetical protein